MLKFFALTFLTISSPTNALLEYQPLSDISMFKGTAKNIDTDIYTITYTVYSYDIVDSYIEDRIGSIIEYSSGLIKEYADEKNLPIYDCQGDQLIEFFIIPYAILNDRTRFYDWPYENGDGSDSSNIVALYSPRRGEYGVDSILLTKDSLYKDYYIAHEIAHYWYERLCWDNYSYMKTEPFASSFELYYISNSIDKYGSVNNAPIIKSGRRR